MPCIQDLTAFAMKTPTTKLNIIVATTPRVNSLQNIPEWLQWARQHFQPLVDRCHFRFLAAMPSRPSLDIVDELNRLLPGGDASWAAMTPGFLGAEDTFRAACAFAFEQEAVDYVLHVPIDVAFGVPHANDVQDNERRMLDPILEWDNDGGPGIVVGDYTPMIWDAISSASRPATFKHQIEAHVLQQLRHYFPGCITEKLSITRPRSEFFVLSRKLFQAVSDDRRFWPWDPIPQILIYAERKGCGVRRVDIGHFYVEDRFSPAQIRDQVWRTAMQISAEWLRWEHDPALTTGQLRQLTPVWEERVAKGNRMAFENLRGLLKSRSDASETNGLLGEQSDMRSSTDSFLVAYVMAEGLPMAEDLRLLYEGTIPDGHPLAQLVRPVDQRGEVAAWGGPHWTVLDALTVHDPVAFTAIVQRLARRFQRPTIIPKNLAIFGGTALVVRCEVRGLDELRSALIRETRPLLVLTPLTDEETQRAYWWVELHDNSEKSNLKALQGALQFHREAGSPPLPSSRHFRLGFLVRLYKEWQRADDEHKPGRESRLRYYLSLGEPPWYRGKTDFHLTLASGLTDNVPLSHYVDTLWPYITSSFQEFRPERLALLSEDKENPVSVHFYDWLTEKPIPEVRPGFKIDNWAEFEPRL